MRKFIDLDEFLPKLEALISSYEKDYDEADPFYEAVRSCIASSSVIAVSRVRSLIKSCDIVLECEVNLNES